MKKYIQRSLIAILTFSIGMGTIYFSAWDEIKFLNPSKATHSAENNSPYSVLEGTTVRIKPYDATFEIPESWLTPNPIPTPAKNLYLSYQELNELYGNDGSDAEEAQVINSVLSFADCAAHVGDRGWGNYLWNDLQGRVYITDLTPEAVAPRVEKQGRNKASKLFERVSVISGNHGKWEERTLDILDAPSWSDFILAKSLDFCYRSFGSKTVVFVFLHADRFDKEINLLLDSFKWSNES
jgi:hypothetical protein